MRLLFVMMLISLQCSRRLNLVYVLIAGQPVLRRIGFLFPKIWLKQFVDNWLRLLPSFLLRRWKSAKRFRRTLIGTAVAAGATLIAGDISPHNFSGPFILKNVNIDMEIMQSAVFAPLLMIIGVQGEEEAALLTNQCAYALGATIFGSTELAISVASKLNVGTVVINDMIMPTADPRLSFGGRGSSGFGLTRGAAGLLEMTVQKALMIRRNRRLFHLDDPHPVDHELFSAFLVVSHGAGWYFPRKRWRSSYENSDRKNEAGKRFRDYPAGSSARQP
jgi:hypothetical protein